MTRWNPAAILFALMGATGCVGTLAADDTGDDFPPGSAREMFESDVSPMLESQCSSCHAGAEVSPYKFLGAVGKTDNYTKLAGDPSMHGNWNPDASQFMLHSHSGGEPELTAASKSVIAGWLLLEADERGVVTEPPVEGARTARDALAKWSACMTEADWLASGMQRWADHSSSGGKCLSCHSYGAGGYLAVADDTEMFNMNRYEIFIEFFFKAQPAAGGTYEVVANTSHPCARADTAGHPSYLCQANDPDVAALQDFYTRTRNALAACTETPGFPTPPSP